MALGSIIEYNQKIWNRVSQGALAWIRRFCVFCHGTQVSSAVKTSAQPGTNMYPDLSALVHDPYAPE